MKLLSKRHRPFLTRRLHSLTGVLPLALFFVWHLVMTARATQGKAAFDAAVRRFEASPILRFIDVTFVLLPLAFHAVYGTVITLRSRPNVTNYPLRDNWSYTLERVTGLLTLAFLGYHLSQFRVSVLVGRMYPSDFYAVLTRTLSSTTASGIPVSAMLYLLGLAAASYHLARGIAGFCFTWGLTSSARTQRLVSAVCGGLGLSLFVFGANTVVYFATGAHWFVSRNERVVDLPSERLVGMRGQR